MNIENRLPEKAMLRLVALLENLCDTWPPERSTAVRAALSTPGCASFAVTADDTSVRVTVTLTTRDGVGDLAIVAGESIGLGHDGSTLADL